ncbi:MAG: glycosyltransferase family 2 protein [Phototrophicaceae bacterium]
MVNIGISLLFWVSFTLLIWTYFGYPLLMYIWAKIAPIKRSATDPIEPSVTILIPTYNEIDVIRRKIENSLALEYPKDKLTIIIVDDDSNDGTKEVIAEYEPDVILINKEVRSGKMQSVNIGMARADSDIVILSDASPDYEPHSITALMSQFRHPDIGVVVGTLAVWDEEKSVAKSAGLYWKYEAALRKWESRTGNTVAVHGNMFAIRRELFRPMTGQTINDEFSIAMEVIQQGYHVVYEPSAISYDHASTHMEDEFKRRVRINAGRYQALFDAGYLSGMPTFDDTFRLFSHKLLRPLAPILMILVLISNILLVALVPNWLYGILLFGQFIFYDLALLGWILSKRQIKIRVLNIFYFFVSTNIAALFGFWRWMRGSQAVTWQKRTTVES